MAHSMHGSNVSELFEQLERLRHENEMLGMQCEIESLEKQIAEMGVGSAQMDRQITSTPVHSMVSTPRRKRSLPEIPVKSEP